ncbi:MAG: molybdopterin molybdotransferase MoeA [Pelagibacteraceae bacterium]
MKNLKNETLSENIYAKKDNPSFNNSLLDGFVFKSSDTKNNSHFKLNGELAVGQNKKIKYLKNTCYRVSTGGKIIQPYDCMLPYEQVEIIDALIEIPKKIKKFSNVRLTGSDFKKGDLLIKKNQKITPAKKLLIKSSGNENIQIYETPNIILFCSGDEISDKIVFNDKVINSIPEYINTYKEVYNFNFKYLGIVKDNKNSINKFFSKIKNLNNSIIVSTGGVSAGHKDYFPKFLTQKKYKILFHKIGMQPGRPTLFATKNNNYYFGLPGNPISSIVGFHFLIVPLILSMQNLKIKMKSCKISHNYKKNPNLTELRRGLVTKSGIKIIPDQESYKLNSLVKANCWLLLDQKSNFIKKGDKIKYIDYEN